LAERRVGWVKTGDWKSVYLGNLISSSDLYPLEYTSYYPKSPINEPFQRSIDKRKFNRFTLKDYGFAIFRPSSKIAGRIIDISKGGLSFRYANIHEKELSSSHMDIFILSSGFYSDNLSYKIVFEQNVDIELPDSSTPTNQCGVMFNELTPIQKTQLDVLIQSYTTN